MKQLSLFILSVFFILTTYGQQTIDLSGKWKFAIDREDVGETERWFEKQLNDFINLPGSMPEKLKGDDISVNTQWTGSLYDSSYFFNPRMEKYRQEGNIKLPFFLTPDKHYIGVAWYQKTITIPRNWKQKQIELFLERPHIETTVWIDGKQIASQNSLCVPHVYNLSSYLTPGQHTITIKIDNRTNKINPGPDSHSITDQTQGNWNGIVGRIELIAKPLINFEDIQVYPDLSNRKAVVKMDIHSNRKTKATVTLATQSFNNIEKSHILKPVKQDFNLENGRNSVEMELEFGEEMLTWDEFSPTLYHIVAELVSGKEKEVKEVTFGMREFTIEGKYFYVNGNKTMLRGTVENCCFPLTGYAPMDVDSWVRVYNICKSYGLNHMRFHSYCPPEAAFIAADLTGFYLQPEGPSWPNHGGVSLGNKQPIDEYLMEETIRLTKEYGNYASYCMLASGNEPRGRWVPWVTKFVNYWKETDSRRVYTGASVGGSWQWQPANEFHVKAGARGLDWGKQPHSMDDYSRNIDTVRQPFVSHETGQWCAFPNFNEIRKYTGVNKAKNFEIFRDLLNEGGMEGLGQDFMMASGKLQALCYKYEIERTLRTPGYAGFQLLSLNDYSGQGTALVGVLDVFFEEKGYINAPEFRRFCNSTVPLARIPKFVYINNEEFTADIEMYHFGNTPLENAFVTYTIRDNEGNIINKGNITQKTFEIGNCQPVGNITMPLNNILKPQKLNLEVAVAGTEFINDWDFWVYPQAREISQGDIYVTDTLDNKTLEVLENGGNVLLLAAGKISYGKEIIQHFMPVFWNTSWFKMRPPHTTGILLNEYHPVFRNFPTEYHSNLQWWELLNRAQVMRLTDFPMDFQPLVYSIDTWFLSRKASMLFEANVLNGKLVMSSMDLTSEPEKRVVARELYACILEYMQSDQFRPDQSLDPIYIRDLFIKEAPAIDFGTKDAPDELKPKSSLDI